MKITKKLWRALSILTLIATLCGSFAVQGVDRPVKAAPKMQSLDHLIISEIRFHGSDGPNDEFIEILNPTGSEVNLNGWKIDANSGNRYTFTNDFLLQPGQHYLLVHTGFDDGIEADAIYLQAIADDGGIALINQNGDVIDKVGLSDGNHFEGTPLTPLKENIDQSYDRISDSSTICQDTDDNSIDFFLRNPSDPQNSKDAYSPAICGIPTTTPTSTSTPTNTPTVNVPGTFHSIIINEVAWSGTRANPTDEWIELFNPTNNAIDLAGWVLKSDDGSPTISLDGLKIAERSFLLLARNTGTFTDITPDLIYGPLGANQELRDSGEILRLINKSGTFIDTANSYTGYGFSKWVQGTGSPNFASMERGAYLFSHPSEWVTYGGSGNPDAHDRANNLVFGTPGDPNWINATARSITTIISDTPDPSLVNGLVTVTVTVVGGTTVPTGNVSITGANTNCTITLSSGIGSCATVKFTSTGSKTITATYNADANHPSSTDTEPHQVTSSLVTTPTRVPTPLPPPPLVVINEFVPRPGRDWNNDGVVNVGDEYIEVLNHGVVNVDLSGYSLDDELNIGSMPYRLPAVTIRPGERYVFYGSETGLLLGDGGDGVRLLKPNGQLADAYNYTIVERPDQSYCRLPDNGGADDWNRNCYPTPGLQNSLSQGSTTSFDDTSTELYCPIADTLPDAFAEAECEPFGNNIWRPGYWDQTGWFGDRYLPGINTKWPVFAN